MRIEVVYALARKQELLVLELAPGSTILDAIEASGLLRREPQIEFSRAGIWGRPASPETKLRDRDRVELYRPLLADPKSVRRERAAKSRK
jgi:putative ubiquitin-RnfH superfamily antitoxin RatB of RatAB toxin-antitoxin module